MAGRPPKPTQIKKLQGTQKKCRENKNEPQFDAISKMPPPPEYLTEYGRRLWGTGAALVVNNILQAPDIPSFENFCRIYQRCLKSYDLLDDGDFLENITGEHGGRSALIQQISADEKTLIKYFNEFGFTPVSRGRLGIGKKPDSDPDIEKMKRLLGA